MIKNDDNKIVAGVNQEEYRAIFDFNKKDSKVALREISGFKSFIKRIIHNNSKSNHQKNEVLLDTLVENEINHTK